MLTKLESDKLKEIFSIKLSALLEDGNINQSELADMLGVDESTVGKWILRKSLPRMGIIEKLSSIFNRPKSYFLDENEYRKGYYLDPSAAKMAQELYDNPEMRILFDAAKNVSPDDLKFVAEMMLRMKKKENHEDD